MFPMMHMSSRSAVMGTAALPHGLALLAWEATAGMAVTVDAMSASALR